VGASTASGLVLVNVMLLPAMEFVAPPRRVPPLRRARPDSRTLPPRLRAKPNPLQDHMVFIGSEPWGPGFIYSTAHTESTQTSRDCLPPFHRLRASVLPTVKSLMKACQELRSERDQGAVASPKLGSLAREAMIELCRRHTWPRASGRRSVAGRSPDSAVVRDVILWR
jgi:hypothetical protein